MNDFQKRLKAKRGMTPRPGQGYNLVGLDDYEEPGDELYLVGQFKTWALADGARRERRRRKPDEALFIYGSELEVEKPEQLIRSYKSVGKL